MYRKMPGIGQHNRTKAPCGTESEEGGREGGEREGSVQRAPARG
jgi:hypothetical protein